MFETKSGVFLIAGVFFFGLSFVVMGVLPWTIYYDEPEKNTPAFVGCSGMVSPALECVAFLAHGNWHDHHVLHVDDCRIDSGLPVARLGAVGGYVAGVVPILVCANDLGLDDARGAHALHLQRGIDGRSSP